MNYLDFFGSRRERFYPFPSAGIIHRYNFEEISGTVSNDLVGTENGVIQPNVTLGAPGFNSGDLAYDFDGSTNSYVSYNPFLGGTDNFSIYIRFRKNTIDSSTILFNGWLGSTSFIIRTITGDGEIPEFVLVTNNGRVDLSSFANTINLDWQEFIVTYNGSVMTLQTDQNPMISATQIGVMNTSSEYRLGHLNSSLTGAFDCDELIIWDRALSEEEQNGTFKLPKP